jgi:hypothetical protein
VQRGRSRACGAQGREVLADVDWTDTAGEPGPASTAGSLEAGDAFSASASGTAVQAGLSRGRPAGRWLGLELRAARRQRR